MLRRSTRCWIGSPCCAPKCYRPCRPQRTAAMCNLYTYKLSRDEIRGLMQHYKLIGTEWAEQFD